MTKPFLKNPNLNVLDIVIDTPRCTLKVFHMEWVDFNKLTHDFCAANKDLYVSQYLPNVDEEKVFIQEVIEKIDHWEAIEFFIYDKKSGDIIGCCGINSLHTEEPNIGLWIVPEFHWQWLWSEMYEALIEWIKINTYFTFIKHCCHPENTPSIWLVNKFQWELQSEKNERGHLKYYIKLTS